MNKSIQNDTQTNWKSFLRSEKFKTWALLFFIIALGLFLRSYNINNTPPGIYPDEAVNGVDAITANATGNYQWFYPANQGREGLFMNIIAILFNFFGVSILTLKLPAIIFGTLTILGTYLLGKEILNKRIGLISAFLVSVSFWAINFSRISFRANMLPFILTFSFYFLFKAIRTKKYSDFAIGGFIFGIGVHTYIAFRIAPAILIILLLSFLVSRRDFLKEYWKKILLYAAFVTIAAAPMLYTLFYAHPEYMESRSANISVFSPQVNQGHLIPTFMRSLGLSLAKYNLWGDQNWRHNYPPYPILDPLSGIAFAFGFIFCLIYTLYFFYLRLFKKERRPLMDIYVFFLAWFFIMLAPEFLTAEGNPHALRSIGTLPVVFLFAGITFDFLLKIAEKHGPLFRKTFLGLVIFTLIIIGLFNGIKYHYFWANQEKVGFSFNKNLTDIQKNIKTLPKEQEKFVITSYNTLEHGTIGIFVLQNNVTFLYPNELEKLNPKNPTDFIVFLVENNKEAMTTIQQKFPNLALQKIEGTLGSVYYILK